MAYAAFRVPRPVMNELHNYSHMSKYENPRLLAAYIQACVTKYASFPNSNASFDDKQYYSNCRMASGGITQESDSEIEDDRARHVARSVLWGHRRDNPRRTDIFLNEMIEQTQQALQNTTRGTQAAGVVVPQQDSVNSIQQYINNDMVISKDQALSDTDTLYMSSSLRGQADDGSHQTSPESSAKANPVNKSETAFRQQKQQADSQVKNSTCDDSVTATTTDTYSEGHIQAINKAATDEVDLFKQYFITTSQDTSGKITDSELHPSLNTDGIALERTRSSFKFNAGVLSFNTSPAAQPAAPQKAEDVLSQCSGDAEPRLLGASESVKGSADQIPIDASRHKQCNALKCDAIYCDSFLVEYSSNVCSEYDKRQDCQLDLLSADAVQLTLRHRSGYLRQVPFQNLRDFCNQMCRPDASALDFGIVYIKPLQVVYEHNYIVRYEEGRSAENLAIPGIESTSTAEFETAVFDLKLRVWRGLQSPNMHPEIRQRARYIFRKQYDPCYTVPENRYVQFDAEMTDTDDESTYSKNCICKGINAHRSGCRTPYAKLFKKARQSSTTSKPPTEPRSLIDARTARLQAQIVSHRHDEHICTICATRTFGERVELNSRAL